MERVVLIRTLINLLRQILFRIEIVEHSKVIYVFCHAWQTLVEDAFFHFVPFHFWAWLLVVLDGISLLYLLFLHCL